MKTYDRTYDGEVKVEWDDLILPKVWLFDEDNYLILPQEKNGNKN